jgi:hypothetical protein
MAKLKVALLLRGRTTNGNRPYLNPVTAPNGKIRPLWAEQLGDTCKMMDASSFSAPDPDKLLPARVRRQWHPVLFDNESSRVKTPNYDIYAVSGFHRSAAVRERHPVGFSGFDGIGSLAQLTYFFERRDH